MQKNIISIEDQEIYRYGTEQILINLTTFTVLAIIATSIKGWHETIFFLIGIVPIRVVAGGYHANTPEKCNVLTILVYLFNMLIIHFIKKYMSFVLVIFFLSIMIVSVFIFAPVDHKNKVLTQDEGIKAKKNSRIISIILAIACLAIAVVYEPKNNILISTMMGAMTASVSLIIGNYRRVR